MSRPKFTRYNDRVQLQAATETLDGYGQPIQSWATVATFWASVQPLVGREQVAYRQVWATASYFVTFNWQGADVVVSPRMRLLTEVASKTLNILDVSQVPVDRNYELICEEHDVS